MKEIRIGVAGLNPRGRHWIDLIQKLAGYRITALCDLYQEPIDKALEKVGSPGEATCFRDYEEFLGFDGMDAVALVVRNERQGAMAAEAMEAGKHVHAEVPAAHSLEDCWRIVLAQEQSGKVYQLAEQVRYAGYIEKWRQLVAEGTLGAITYAEGQYFHYYVSHMFIDPPTGALFGPDRLGDYPGAIAAWVNRMPPVHYIVHDLSPLLKVLDDRVVEVIGMTTDGPSRAHPEVGQPDMQVALMKTVKGTLLRLAASFAQPHPDLNTHWQQVIGTRGSVEWGRTAVDKPKAWFADREMQDKEEQEWGFAREDEPEEARNSGHSNLDYYVHAAFRDAILEGRPQELDVYGAMDVAAPSVLAADSIAQDGRRLIVPDFRPNAERSKGQPPGDAARAG